MPGLAEDERKAAAGQRQSPGLSDIECKLRVAEVHELNWAKCVNASAEEAGRQKLGPKTHLSSLDTQACQPAALEKG
jgi:hypothetical protein